MSHDSRSGSAAAPALEPARLRRQTLIFDEVGAGESLVASADRDLETTLQLLAERAGYLTGAASVVIAQVESDEFVCRANAGVAGPQVGGAVAAKSGLITQCVRNRQVVISNGAVLEFGMSTPSISSSEIRSSASIPVIDEEGGVVGLLYLTAERPRAFAEQDISALIPISEAIVTALGHAEAAKRALDEIADAKLSKKPVSDAEGSTLADAASGKEFDQIVPGNSSPAAEPFKISSCHGCGFPVSEGRSWCLDCEQAGSSEGNEGPAFLQMSNQDQGWLQSNFYTIGTLLMICLTVVVLMLKLR